MSDNFMTERITEDYGEAFAPSRYSLKSKADVMKQPYKTYELFYEITFHVIQKLGVYEDLGTPDELRKQKDTIKKLYEILDETCKDQRERNEDDSVCGLCQYDADHGLDGYANECPGFETSECFCMKNEIRRLCGIEEVPEPW